MAAKIGRERLGTIGLEILPELKNSGNKKKDEYRIINGVEVKISSQRYPVFQKSLTCPICHCTGSYFAIERPIFPPSARWHLNLYGIGTDGKEVLFTKDHIIPKSKGGKNHISNYQTMCEKCNSLKSNNL